jgi:hypothetical protein
MFLLRRGVEVLSRGFNAVFSITVSLPVVSTVIDLSLMSLVLSVAAVVSVMEAIDWVESLIF